MLLNYSKDNNYFRMYFCPCTFLEFHHVYRNFRDPSRNSFEDSCWNILTFFMNFHRKMIVAGYPKMIKTRFFPKISPDISLECILSFYHFSRDFSIDAIKNFFWKFPWMFFRSTSFFFDRFILKLIYVFFQEFIQKFSFVSFSDIYLRKLLQGLL